MHFPAVCVNFPVNIKGCKLPDNVFIKIYLKDFTQLNVTKNIWIIPSCLLLALAY